MNLISKSTIRHYFCYSKPLADYLYQQGHRVITRALNPETKTMFWLYIITEELSKDLQIWSANKIK